ncbi:MAG TPA: alpha/beta hydrolase [Planctomycetota bacterium]|jgi:acetyl esterase/lipase|nr:alpha/beta hydrolase [Planctomycetota bacterium]
MVLLIAAAAVAWAPAAQEDSKPTIIELWPGRPPGEREEIGPERFLESRPGQTDVPRLTDVSRPTIEVHLPPKERSVRAAVLVCPGGGYRLLAIGHEGKEVAAWLRGLGIAAAVLKYRVPQRPHDPDKLLPLQDAQRALGLLRRRAAEWGVDPGRIGILGFSAGGHLAAHLSTNFASRAYEPVDEADAVSCRPDFAILVYPGGIVDREKTDVLSPRLRVTAETPPAFLVHAGDDRVPVENSVRYYLELRRAGVPAELHLYESGGHGFGIRPIPHPAASWPRRCEDWMKRRGLLDSAK